MDRTFKTNAIILFIFLALMVSYFLYDRWRVSNIRFELHQEFPLADLDSSFGGVVQTIHQPYPDVFNNDPHLVYLTIDPSFKLTLVTGYELNKKLTLDSVLAVGDKIQKDKGSDSLIVQKPTESGIQFYYFQIRNLEGYTLRKTDR